MSLSLAPSALTLHEPQEVQPTRSVLPPSHRPEPLLELDVAEDLVLLGARVADVLEEEVEEGRNDDCLVAVADCFVVDCLRDTSYSAHISTPSSLARHSPLYRRGTLQS